MRVPLSGVVAAALLVAPSPARAAGEPAGQDVVLKTDDNMKLAATWWDEPHAGSAGVVLLHMYASDRAAWKPLVAHLRARGIEVIAVDLRGHGGSAKQGAIDHSGRVQKRDPKLFAEMHRDAIAAVRYLVKQGKCDSKRIALVGASVGCSVAIDTARRYPGETAAVACMTPGAAYLGLDSLEHAKTFPAGEPLLLLTHASEADGGANALSAAVAGSSLVVYDTAKPKDAAEENWAHGTKMFGRIPLVEQTLASFVAARTGSQQDDVVLDGVVDDEAKEGGAWRKATAVASKDVEAWAYRVGRRIAFGGRVRGKAAALRVGVSTNFAPGTFPGFTSNEDVGLPEIAAIDPATGTWAWVEPHDHWKAGKSRTMATRVRPAVRAVKTADGFSFEGEWVTDYGDGPKGPVDPSRVRISFNTEAAIPERPEEMAPGALKLEIDWVDTAVAIPSR
jgi:pimeloyl-ACP methyl ester carboxylesterase